MGMTEKQGGSDVRANTTRAVPAPGGPVEGETYRLTGHKWFCSAPMSDVFLMLAQAPGGLTCFVVPRALDDGGRNAFALQRLKDKLGNHSNASSEVELDGTWGVRLGDEGRGVRTIIDMVGATRLDCVLGSAATMRDAVARAVHHARHRFAFGALLVDQPLMRNVLADLALEAEAATVLGLRLAHAFDDGETDFARLGVALGKFWVCKRAAPMVAEALECLGGNGYVEENGLSRLYREAPLNSIWEGSGNVNALDVLRAVTREPATLEALTTELHRVRGRSSELDAHVESALAQARSLDPSSADAAFGARSVVERLAVALQASLLVEHSPAVVADAFVASRVAGRRGPHLRLARRRPRGVGRRPHRARRLTTTVRRLDSALGEPLLLHLDVEVGRRPGEVHRPQRLEQQLLHGETGIPLVVGRHDVPRRAHGRRLVDDGLVGLHVVQPVAALVDVAGVVLVVLVRSAEPLEPDGRAAPPWRCAS